MRIPLLPQVESNRLAIEKQYDRAVNLLRAHKDKLTQLAEVLLDKEVIFKDNLEKIFGKRPFDKDKKASLEEE